MNYFCKYSLMAFLVLSASMVSIAGCGAGSSTSIGPTPTPTPTPTPAPTPTPTSNGYFRKTKAASSASAISGVRALDATQTTSPTVNMTYERSGHTSTLLSDGRVLVAGGNYSVVTISPGQETTNQVVNNTGELFDPVSETFSLVASTMIEPRTHHCAVTMQDNRVLLIGGSYYWNPAFDASHVDIFDPSTNSFTSVAISGSGLLATQDMQCFLLSNNRVFIFGGATTNTTIFASPAILDLSTWAVRGVNVTGDAELYQRIYSSSVQASDGRVFVVGGETEQYANSSAVASGDILVFDPTNESMNVVGQLIHPRVYAGILPNNDGSIEVYGGCYWDSGGNNIKLTSVEHISQAGVSTEIGDLATTKAYFTSVMLQNGKSLHVGGANAGGTSTNTQIVFDETSYASGFTGDMIEERWEYGISQLATGRVLITGGTNTSAATSNTAEIFEPDANVYVYLPQSSIALGQSMQLTAEYSGSVTWSAKFGTVTSAGYYTAPATVPSGQDAGAAWDEVTATAAGGMTATARFTLLVQ